MTDAYLYRAGDAPGEQLAGGLGAFFLLREPPERSGLPEGHPTRDALATVETAAMAAELAISTVNERGLGRAGQPLETGRAGRLFEAAKWAVRAGLGLRLVRPLGPAAGHASSALFLLAGLAFRLAWFAARQSAGDDEAIVATARDQAGRRPLFSSPEPFATGSPGKS